MTFTEAEAKTKWCPMGAGRQTVYYDSRPEWRGLHEPGQAGTRETPIAEARCIGVACMWWRWKTAAPQKLIPGAGWPASDDEEELRKGEPPRPTDVPAHWPWIPVTGEDEFAEGGYWEEPHTDIDAEYAELLANRTGFCAAAGGLQDA